MFCFVLFMKVLVSGAAGFIGSWVSKALAERGDEVYCVDNINDYYDVRLKYSRLHCLGIDLMEGEEEIPNDEIRQSSRFSKLRFLRMSIEEKPLLDYLFATEHFDIVVNLAAQVGVRYSITHPYTYMQSNLVGFLNIFEACRFHNVKKLVFASSSSVYGLNAKKPYSEDDMVGTPVSLYAVSKRSNELMAHSYSKLYGLQTIGLRYFTVYGPWGRPDMAPMLFATALRDGKPIKVFNNGNMLRDFTYVDDIVEGTIRAIDYDLKPEYCPNGIACRIYNIGCGHPVRLLDFIAELEMTYGKQAQKEFLPMQLGDVCQTYADTTRLEKEMGYRPHWALHDGIAEFVKWFDSEDNPLKAS